MSDPNLAIAITLTHEGGYQDDPKDRANWSSGKVGVGTLIGTKYGITALDMPTLSQAQMQALPQSVAVQFYGQKFWNPFYGAIDNQTIANKLFDMGVLFGVETAVKAFQDALDIKTDGDFGPMTLAAANKANPTTLLEDFQTAMRARALRVIQNNPNDAEDLGGWETRIDS